MTEATSELAQPAIANGKSHDAAGQPVLSSASAPQPLLGSPTSAEQASKGRVNINSATAAEFETLPGIGPVLAQRIVAYRKAHGPFKTVSQLQDVEGIGPKKYAELKAKAYVEPTN